MTLFRKHEYLIFYTMGLKRIMKNLYNMILDFLTVHFPPLFSANFLNPVIPIAQISKNTRLLQGKRNTRNIECKKQSSQVSI